MHDLYAAQIGAIVFQRSEAEGGGAGRSRPVVLGIALKLKAGCGGEDWEDEGIGEEERATFGEVMEMVQECCVW